MNVNDLTLNKINLSKDFAKTDFSEIYQKSKHNNKKLFFLNNKNISYSSQERIEEILYKIIKDIEKYDYIETNHRIKDLIYKKISSDLNISSNESLDIVLSINPYRLLFEVLTVDSLT